MSKPAHYQAFISYRHSNYCRKQAEALERALKRYAKPSLKPPIKIFRDEKHLTPGVGLSQLIKAGLDQSDYLLFLAEKEAAQSPWCKQELEYWCRTKGRADKLIIVHIGDQITIDIEKDVIDWKHSDALPNLLEPYISKIPFYIDLSWIEKEQDSDLENIRYRGIINAITAKFRGVTPEEINDQEIKVYKRNRQLRNTAIALLSFLLLVSVITSVLAWDQTLEADRQKQVAIKQEGIAIESAHSAQKQRELALEQKLLANLQRDSAKLERDRAQLAGAEAIRQEGIAHDNAQLAKTQKDRALLALDFADRNKAIRDRILTRFLLVDDRNFNKNQDTLLPGAYDKYIQQEELEAYIEKWHTGRIKSIVATRNNQLELSEQGNWIPVKPSSTKENTILYLQLFLVDAGLLQPEGITGIFGYETLSGVRQFQELNFHLYAQNSIPNGMVMPETWEMIFDWKDNKISSEYGSFSNVLPSEEHQQWITFLEKIRNHYRVKESKVAKQIRKLEDSGDTKKVEDWTTSKDSTHIICIRRNADIKKKDRPNDDVFILLIKGQVFKFWGSTDPNPKAAQGRLDQAFLVEGQHHFKFSWVYSYRQLYRTIVPFGKGVLVCRDWNKNNALDVVDLERGIDARHNSTIPFLWTGIGNNNVNAGALTIAGKNYINQNGELVDCLPYAGNKRSELDTKTRGAYNSMLDMVTVLSKRTEPSIIVTLVNEEDFLHIGKKLKKDYLNVLKTFELSNGNSITNSISDMNDKR